MRDRIDELRYIIGNHPDNTRTALRSINGDPFIPRLCKDLGIANSTLYDWVNGKSKPSKRHIRNMIKVVPKYLAEIAMYKKS